MKKLIATRTACFVTKANHSERMGRKATCLGSKGDGRGAAGETVRFASVCNQVSLRPEKTLVCSPAQHTSFPITFDASTAASEFRQIYW